MTSNQNLAKKVKALREMRGQSLTAFSKDTHIPKSTLHRTESGNGTSLFTVDDISKKLNVPVSALLSDEIPADQLAVFVQLVKFADLFVSMEESDLEKLVGHLIGMSEIVVKYQRKKKEP